MLYDAYEVQRSLLAGASKLAGLGAGWLNNPANPWGYSSMGPMVAASLEVFAHATAPHGKPEFGIEQVHVGRKDVPVNEEILLRNPFGQLKHFYREGIETGPSLLIVAPMSGHYATLLRGTVERLLPSFDVYITDWRDAKLVPVSDGSFNLDDYIDYLVEFLELIGTKTGERPHMLAVCQPAVPAFAATALMNEDKNPWRPKTLTMMGGPIDSRMAPTAVNTLATQRPFSWFEQNVIATVPMIYPGAGRKVYPGFLQLAGFMTMNLGSHLISHWEMFKHLVVGDEEGAHATQKFYDEYRSVCAEG
jgi:poly(3-hydroxybutyrate) depolymerase